MSFLWALLRRLLGLSARISCAEVFRRGALSELADFEAELAQACAADIEGEYAAWAADTMDFLDRAAFAHAPHRCARVLALRGEPVTLASLRARCAAVRVVLMRAPSGPRPLTFKAQRSAAAHAVPLALPALELSG